MVQRKVLSKLGIQAENVTCDKHLENLKLSSSQNQHGKNKGSDRKKKMKKSRLIKLSDVEALQSPPPPRRGFSQPGKAPPLLVPTTAAFLQKHRPFVGTTDSSPNYMRPTRSSDAKKELFPVSLRHTQSGKNPPQKCSGSSKASFVSCKKSTKYLTRSSSLNLVRTLTKSPSFKPSRTSPRKSTAAVLCADMNPPVRPTCSSTLKDSKFPKYLMLNPGGTEFEGTSVVHVCPYRYCSLNGHHHAPLPPLKSFVSAKRRLLKSQKSMKLERLSPQRLKMPCETNDTAIEQNVLEHGRDESDICNPVITPLAQEIGVDFFIKIYVKEKEGADYMGKFGAKQLEDQDNIQFAGDENGIADEEGGVQQVNPMVTHPLPKCEINLEEGFKKYICAAANEVDAKGSFYQEQNAEDADENLPPCWFHEEIYMGTCCSEVSCDGEHMENIELDVDGSDSQENYMEWQEEEQFCSFDHEENIDSSVFTGEIDSNFESLLESSHDVSVTQSDDIRSCHHVDILVEEALQKANGGENTCFEEQPHGTNSVLEGASESMEFETQETDFLSSDMSFDQSPPTEEVFQHLISAEDNDGETENHVVDDEAGCTTTKVLDEEMAENSQGHEMSETCEADENHKESKTSLENNDEGTRQENQIHLSDALVESDTLVQEQQLLEEDPGEASKFQSTGCIAIGGEYQNTSKRWQWTTKRKRPVQDDEEMRRINPRKPKFLPLVPEPEPEKVNLKHQMMDERKNAEEWMVDFALRQAVTQLAPARKRKVALLVEAFETIVPIPKCESHMRSNSPFAHARPIQACS